jgi:hypothetical protein
MVEHPPNKHKALSSNPSTAKKKPKTSFYLQGISNVDKEKLIDTEFILEPPNEFGKLIVYHCGI